MRLIRSVPVLALAAGLVSATALQSGQDPFQDPSTQDPSTQGPPSAVDPSQVPDLPEVAPEEVEPPTKAVAGSYAQAMLAVHEAVRAEETGEALAMARGLLEESWLDGVRSRVERWSPSLARQTLGRLRAPLGWLGLRSLSGEQRGEVHYTIGTLMLVEGEALEAGGSFELAAYEAGPGEVRLDSLYGLGWIDLVTGEALRQQIPEIAGQQGTPPAAAPPAGGGGGADEEPPDYLNLARTSYRAAKAHFVERLRLDSSDADTRANVELILRRLRELDEIERQREEQEQESDDQQESDEDSQSQQEQDDSEEDEEESEQEEQDESEDEQEEPSEDQQEPQEQEGETDEEQEEQSFQRDVPEEKFMTKEEMKRLLDRLHEIDEKGEALRERLRGRQRVPVKKDW